MDYFQIWAGDEKIGDPLPGEEAVDAFRDQLDPGSSTDLFLLPVGYEPPQRRWGA